MNSGIMKYEWTSIKPCEDVWDKGDFILTVKFAPTGLFHKWRGKTAQFRMYIGRHNDWQRYPSIRLLDDKDPPIEELNKMFFAAKQNVLGK